MLGNAYEYLIKHFADLTNKKAGEFYTPRAVVQLMGMIMDPKEGESIYDPACGTGGMLLESMNHLKNSGKDHRTLKLYGQEKTYLFIYRQDESILTGLKISRSFIRYSTKSWIFPGDELQKFDCVIANPFSLKNGALTLGQ